MTYDPNVPQFPSDSFATSQPQIQDNFQALYNAFLMNHVPLDALTNAGNHTIIQLTEQGTSATIGPQTSVSEMALYTKDVIGQTDQLYLRYQGNGQEVLISNYQIYALPNFNGQVRYFTFLPGGIIVYFGTVPGVPISPITLQNIDLAPYVTKNVITAMVNVIGTIPARNLKVALYPATGGIFQTMAIANSSPGFPIPNCFYIVMGNT